MAKGQFLAILKRTTRNDENDCVIAFSADAQQIDQVNRVPAQTLLKINWEETT